MKKWLLTLLVPLLFGCSEKKPASPPALEPPEPAAETASGKTPETHPVSTGKIVEDVTGITSLKSGRKAQDQIRQINADYNRHLEQALDDNK